MAEQQYVVAAYENGRITVKIDDYELEDMFSDIFTEQFDLDVEYFTANGEFPNEQYILTFKEGTSFEKVQEAIASVSQIEIERVWQLNKVNPWKDAVRPRNNDWKTIRKLAFYGAGIAVLLGYWLFRVF